MPAWNENAKPDRRPVRCWSLRVSLHVHLVPASWKCVLFQFPITSFKNSSTTLHPAVERQPTGQIMRRGPVTPDDYRTYLTMWKTVHGSCFEPMCGILFSSRRHTCTATWQLQRAVCWWGVHGWIKTSRLKPQAVQPRLIPLDKVPVRHSRQHLSKSLIYSSPLLHYPSTCPLMGRTALFREALTFTQACNSTNPDNGWNLMGKK